MSRPASRLRVIEDAADPDADEFSVKGQLREVDTALHRKTLNWFYDIDIETGTSFPLYELLWRDIALTGLEASESLLVLMLFASRLDSCIEDASYQEVECVGLPRRYRLVVEDIADAHDIDVIRSSETKAADRKRNLSSWVQNLKKTVFMLGDQVLSQFLRPFVRSAPSANIAIFPFSSREDSIIPVLRCFDQPPNVFRHAIAAAALSSENEFIERYAGRDAINFDHVSTIKTLLLELLFLFGLFREMLITRQLEKELTERIKTDFELDLKQSIEYTVKETYKANIRELLFGVVMRDVFDRSEYNVAVVGGMSVRDRAIVDAAQQRGVETCYIPHSIGTYPDPLPQSGTTHFTAGELDVKHYRRVYGNHGLPELVPTGRPYLDDLKQELDNRSIESSNSGEKTLVLATQPYDDSVRERFLQDCLQAASSSFDEVVVKIHPSESTTFYRECLKELPADTTETRVEDSDLLSNLLCADLVVTITSNVGIEAVIAGSPCVCYNPWHPMITDQPYVTDGDIPSATDVAELRAYFEREQDDLESLRETQQSFVYDAYRIDGGAADRIATHIERLAAGN